MAPSNGSAKARKPGGGGNKTTKAAAKPVLPAIPLPFVKRRAAAEAAASVASTPSTAASKSVGNVSPQSNKPRTETKLANGVASTHETLRKDAPSASPELDVTGPQFEKGPEMHDAVTQSTDDQDTPATSASKQPSTIDEKENAAKGSIISDHPDQPTIQSETSTRAQELKSQPLTDPPAKPNGISLDPEMQERIVHPSVAKFPAKARPPPAVSPTRYQMPPSFQPGNRPLGIVVNGDMTRGPRPSVPNAPPHMHQPHLSNGSVHFGGFHGSATSSPAPPHSGGIAPPPGMPIPDGRPHYMGHGANGFPPMVPFGADMIPVSSFDTYGRPAMAYGPPDAYPSYGNNFGPSTPHSFHDSQASAHPEDNNTYPQHSAGPIRNGVTAYADDVHSPNNQGRFGGPDYPRMMQSHGPPPHPLSHMDDGDEFVGYLRQQFGAPDFADCTLELRYTDDRQAPVRIPGHRLVYARSPELARIIRQSPQTRHIGQPQVILLETNNKWIRSDSFYFAVQRLYGLPLLSIPPPSSNLKQPDVTEAGSPAERFDYALSYAAAGHLLAWEPIARRGCETAVQLISWQTIDRALEFALEEHCDKGSYDIYKYGECSRVILNEVVAFIINNLPPNFSINESIVAARGYARLPPHPTPPSPVTAQKPSMPAIAHGTTVQLGRNRRSQQITGIQFGDLSLSDTKSSVASETPKVSHHTLASHATLTRALLNIPFAHLKMALESAGLNTVNGWANAEYRYRIIKEAVAEREKRRLQAVDAVKNGLVPDWEAIWQQLSTPEPRYYNQWGALGWQEEILPAGNANGPALGRQWVPLVNPHHTMGAAYP